MEDAVRAAKSVSTTRNEPATVGISRSVARAESTAGPIDARTAEKTNQILKAKLIQFQRQNNSNVASASSEIAKMKDDITQADAKNRQLVAELETATKRMQQIMSEGCKAEQEREARGKEERQGRKAVAERMGDRVLALRVFREWKECMRLIGLEKGFARLKGEHMLGRVFHVIKRCTLVGKMIKCWTQSRDKFLMHKVLRCLGKFAKSSRRTKQFLRMHASVLAHKSFCGFKSFPQIRLSHARKQAAASSLHVSQLKRKAVLGIKQWISRIYLSPEEERQARLVSAKFRALRTANAVLQHWKALVISRRPGRARNQTAMEFYVRLACKRVLLGLRTRLLARKLGEKKLQYFQLARRKWTLQKFMLMFRIHVRNKRKNLILQNLGKKVQLKRMMLRWRRAYSRKADRKESVKAIRKFAEAKMVKRVWRGFALEQLRRNKEALMVRAVGQNHLRFLLARCLKVWTRQQTLKRVFSEVAATHQESIMSDALRRWKQRHWTKQARIAKTHCAIVLSQTYARKSAKTMLREWVSAIRRKRGLAMLMSRFISGAKLSTKRDAFVGWLRALARRLGARTRAQTADCAEEKLRREASVSLLAKLEQVCKDAQVELDEVRQRRVEVADELNAKAATMDSKETEWRQLKEQCLSMETKIKSYDQEFAQLESKKETAASDLVAQQSKFGLELKKMQDENATLTQAVARAEREAKGQQEDTLRVEQELMQMHRGNAGGDFRELEEVAATNQQLMLTLESKRRELAALEETLRGDEEANVVLNTQIGQISDSQNVVAKSKDERIGQLTKQVF